MVRTGRAWPRRLGPCFEAPAEAPAPTLAHSFPVAFRKFKAKCSDRSASTYPPSPGQQACLSQDDETKCQQGPSRHREEWEGGPSSPAACTQSPSRQAGQCKAERQDPGTYIFVGWVLLKRGQRQNSHVFSATTRPRKE